MVTNFEKRRIRRRGRERERIEGKRKKGSRGYYVFCFVLVCGNSLLIICASFYTRQGT